MKIGIRREDKNKWERRTPVVPIDVGKLIKKNISFVIQSNLQRIFSDDEYREVNAPIDGYLDDCDVILGVKEMPSSVFAPGKTYMFFSHTIKGQPDNMPMLKTLMERKCSLIDYEKIVDGKGRRKVFFGPFAGQAGMIDSLWTLGRRLEWEGISSPFQKVKQTINYTNLEKALTKMESVGMVISNQGLPENSVPMVVGVLGYGNVAKGALQVLDQLPCIQIEPKDLKNFINQGSFSSRHIYKVVFTEKDLVQPIKTEKPFQLQEYYDQPDKYRSIFEPNLQYLTVLVNCIYWTRDYPTFVPVKAIEKLFSQPNRSDKQQTKQQTKLQTKADLKDKQKFSLPSLRVIGDITCDVKGSIEINVKSTHPGNPVYVYDPATKKIWDGVAGNGPVILAVDNLPCELPKDSSVFFSDALLPYLEEISQTDLNVPFDSLSLSEDLKNAFIVFQGELTPNFKYLEKHLEP